MKILRGVKIDDQSDKLTQKVAERLGAPQGGDRLVLVNCSIQGGELIAGYFYCDKNLSAGNYRLTSEQGHKLVVKLPDQAVGLPGAGQQFNYPFQIVEEIST